MTKTYKLQVIYEMTAMIEVEANSIEEADQMLDNMDIGEMKSEYLKNSFHVNKEHTEDINEDISIKKEIQEYYS